MAKQQKDSGLKRIQYDKHTVIYVLPHVKEETVRESFDKRNTSDGGGMAYLGMMQEGSRRR